MRALTGVIRVYDWGDRAALATILGHEPPGHPEAEYWLGTHPGGPGRLGPDGEPLDEAIRRRPADLLGADVADRFGGLPFLVKILAAAKPLSIQAHPSLIQARAGFAREERDGPSRDAPSRNYRDPNHKPELICALTPFEARCGLRDPSVTDTVLAPLGEAAAPVRSWLDQDGPAGVAARLLRLPTAEGARLAAEVVEAAAALVEASAGGPDLQAEYRSTVAVGQAFPGDVGVVVALLLNHLVLQAGEALFLPAGNLHAYLGGVGVEVMASSDNVLRGGLTAKHIDVEELMAIVEPGHGPVEVQRPSGPVHRYDIPVPDFAVTRIDARAEPLPDTTWTPDGPEIVLVTDGSAELVAAGASLHVGRGGAAFVAASDGEYRLLDRHPGELVAWRITVGSCRPGSAGRLP